MSKSAKITRLCMHCSKPLHSADAQERAHSFCLEVAKENVPRTPCATDGCDERVGPNGRYCVHCVTGADRSTASGREVLDFMAERRRPEYEKAFGREFDDTTLDDEAQPVRGLKAAEALVNDWRWRHPDGFIALGRGDLVLFPVYSPKSHMWIVFKCARDAGRGKRFRWIPIEFNTVHPLAGRYDAPDAFEVRMDEAWELATRWRMQLETIWQQDTFDSMWREHLSFGGEVWAMREEQDRERERAVRSEVILDADGRYAEVQDRRDPEAAERMRRKRQQDGTWTR